jgi:hypothetical protein
MNEQISEERDIFEGPAPGRAGFMDATVALKKMLDIVSNVAPENRQRLLQSLAAFFDLSQAVPSSASNGGHRREGIPFSEEKVLSPKEFLFQKKPQTDVERVAALAYYLTHYRDTPYFKTLDISKLNTEAAQSKFSNAAYAVDNAAKCGYLVPASKGNKQLGAVGEVFVQALPDREAAKDAMQGVRPRRKTKKGTQSKEKSRGNAVEAEQET